MSRTLQFAVAGVLFDVLGTPGTTDRHTAFGYRRTYYPDEPIILVWKEVGR